MFVVRRYVAFDMFSKFTMIHLEKTNSYEEHILNDYAYVHNYATSSHEDMRSAYK